MLEVRVQELEKHIDVDFKYNESLMARLVPFLRKEAAEKEVGKKEAEIEQVPSEEDDDNE
jgi:hypothetical protein